MNESIQKSKRSIPKSYTRHWFILIEESAVAHRYKRALTLNSIPTNMTKNRKSNIICNNKTKSSHKVFNPENRIWCWEWSVCLYGDNMPNTFFIKLQRLFVVIKVEQLCAKQRTFNMICNNGQWNCHVTKLNFFCCAFSLKSFFTRQAII